MKFVGKLKRGVDSFLWRVKEWLLKNGEVGFERTGAGVERGLAIDKS